MVALGKVGLPKVAPSDSADVKPSGEIVYAGAKNILHALALDP